MREPTRPDILFALWSLLALPEHDEVDPAALEELFDDLHRDLDRAADDDFDELFIAVG